MNNQEKTNNALIEQLVYIDNFINKNDDLTPTSLDVNSDFNNQLSLDLSAFADDSFVFADEEKPAKPDDSNHLLDELISNSSNSLSNLPRFPVPPGAKDSLQRVGLNQNQIDLLSALIAQYQSLQHHHQQTQQENTDLHNIFPHYSPTTPVELKQSSSSFHLDNPGSVSSTSSINSVDDRSTNDLDKKRRNTAASARFRIKKKLKEKQMEEKLSNLGDTIKDFESKIQQLETENKLLKKLIIEKGSEKSDHELRMLKARVIKDESEI